MRGSGGRILLAAMLLAILVHPAYGLGFAKYSKTKRWLRSHGFAERGDNLWVYDHSVLGPVSLRLANKPHGKASLGSMRKGDRLGTTEIELAPPSLWNTITGRGDEALLSVLKHEYAHFRFHSFRSYREATTHPPLLSGGLRRPLDLGPLTEEGLAFSHGASATRSLGQRRAKAWRELRLAWKKSIANFEERHWEQLRRHFRPIGDGDGLFINGRAERAYLQMLKHGKALKDLLPDHYFRPTLAAERELDMERETLRTLVDDFIFLARTR